MKLCVLAENAMKLSALGKYDEWQTRAYFGEFSTQTVKFFKA